MEKVKIHHDGDRKRPESCHFGHQAFMFMGDVTDNYSSACENRAVFSCICLECGAFGDYELSRFDRARLTVYPNSNNYKGPFPHIAAFYDVRRKYKALLELGLTKEEAIKNINLIYKKEQLENTITNNVSINENNTKEDVVVKKLAK